MKGTRGWLHPSIVSAAGLAVAAGFAQFGASAALADVAAAFGEPQPEIGVTARAGLTGTTLGIGLAIIRMASLGALPLAALADRAGRRRVVLICTAIGLSFTVGAAFSPSFWWFVAIFALGRPLLSATNAVAGVIAAEETQLQDRSKAIALIGAAYGVGAGLTAVVRGAAADVLGFRGVFALAIVPLLLLPVAARRLGESRRYSALDHGVRMRVLAPVPRGDLRVRLALLATLMGAIGLVTGPANMFLFYFAESVQGITPSTMALVVLAAGPTGLTGLIAGRWAADRVGRRITATLTLAVVAVAATITYNLGPGGVIAGYLIGILASGAYTPAAGALSAELFPTSVRATAAGWLTAASVVGAVLGLFVFGMLVDFFGGFGGAAIAMAIPVALASTLYLLLPETRGLELEETAPEPTGSTTHRVVTEGGTERS